ncbi:phage holin family protein [Frankia sp. AgB1.9]|uniref:phage holin family protein n=1 Tax=unclassified Frankia TaxID=2632575 RepID=UPI0019323BE5|nr:MULTISPECIES: phage holin family protein [unclassified Frankia]MBL7547929.1 phage holin family protein [Frankia sp. AgB1.9]
MLLHAVDDAVQLALAGAGVLVSARLVDGVRLDGPAGRQALALLLAGAVCWLAIRVPASLEWLVSRRATTLSRQGRGGGAWVLVLTPLGLVSAAAMLYLPQLWVAERLCRKAGLPLRIVDFWTLVVVAIVTYATVTTLRPVAWTLFRPRQASSSLRHAGVVLCCAGALWLVTLAVGGAELAPGAWWREILTFALLGWLFAKINIMYSFYGVPLGVTIPPAAAYAVVANALMLWFTSWFSTALLLTLSVRGFGSFFLGSLLASAVMWAVTWPFFLAGARRPHAKICVDRFGYFWPSAAEDEAEFDRQFRRQAMNHLMRPMSGPYF